MRPAQLLPTTGAGFRCTVERVGEIAYVRPIGELDVASTGRFRTILDELRHASVPRIIIDLRSLSFIDCNGLRVILRACFSARLEGSVLQLIPGAGVVDWIFDLTDLRQYFDLTVACVKRP
jgi:anti-sigma B factor antagonist